MEVPGSNPRPSALASAHVVRPLPPWRYMYCFLVGLNLLTLTASLYIQRDAVTQPGGQTTTVRQQHAVVIGTLTLSAAGHSLWVPAGQTGNCGRTRKSPLPHCPRTQRSALATHRQELSEERDVPVPSDGGRGGRVLLCQPARGHSSSGWMRT